MIPNLPAELQAALARKAEGLSRNDAAQRAAAISQTYRSGGGSGRIRTGDDALTYALARMPATYAAIAASLNALTEINPGFAPQSLLDIGAGPGTATWAAAETFASLGSFNLLDANTALRDLALALAQSNPRLTPIHYQSGDARKLLATAPEADLVVASYVINELSESERAAFADAMWARTRDTLLVVDPGTPAGYARIIDLRTRLLAVGAHVIAPCPHDAACPLIAPDWCHFSQRLQRSRAHKHLKDAELPYEDEKFSYIILSRKPASQRAVRVLAQPQTTKIAVTAKLCTAKGVQTESVPHRDKAAYKRAKKWNWGDAVFNGERIVPE
ncbi:small ribosomal subunit Rsm22 family protein [Bradyrhizobium sp. G127]|uniref:small ribosomal subunit Rsm22 family protein n=1 Tax=Bradyrhizobium sp. G127 TaxID=2904800 RepID=UPI001F2049F6|nr:small ribosomal subunit Rsm22 family protein [Bradyrhizobium sp. G127]MCF2525536.1 small ribosomal subunit Rsm22 family protein [Bradyrhizobium sp. G127]